MTMSVTITNTSNWAREDIQVGVTGGRNAVLEPGASMQVAVLPDKTLGVILEPRPDKPVPLRDRDGKQVEPVVNVTFEEFGR